MSTDCPQDDRCISCDEYPCGSTENEPIIISLLDAIKKLDMAA